MYYKKLSFKNKRPLLTSGQITYHIFSFVINKTPGRIVNLKGLLNIEMYNDNLKTFTQSLEGMWMTLGKDVDEQMLESLHERQLTKSSLMKSALTLYQSDIVLKTEPRSHKKLRAMVHDILEVKNKPNMLISHEERSRERTEPAHLTKM